MAATTGFIRTTSGSSTESGSGLNSSRLSEVFNKNFLKHAVDRLVLAELVEQFDLPKNAGSLTMRFFRRGEANVDNVRSLTEGTPLTDYTHGTLEIVESTLAQYGDVAKISDTRVATDLIKQLELETARMGEEAALHLDTKVRDEMYTSLTDNANSAQLVDLTASSTASEQVVELKDLDKAASILKENRAPTFPGGHYIAAVSPRLSYDLRSDDKWINVASYSDKEKIYNGEIGKFFNVKVVEHTNPKEFDHNSGTSNGHACFVFGKEFAGTVKLAGSSSPMKPQLIINDKPDKSDALNQYISVGYKLYVAAKVLNPKYGVLIKANKATF